MPKPMTVAVAGATGRQGGAVARLLLDRGHSVRALTRRPESTAAAALGALGASILEADLDDDGAVRRATQGADSLFLMATPYEAGVEAEVRQARRAAKAATEAGVKHVVYSSVASADQKTGIPHFDSKAEVEEYIWSLGVRYTIVAPVFFMENLLAPMFVAGLRAGTLAMPLPADRSIQAVAVDDIAALVRLALERPSEFHGKRIDIASDAPSGAEMAQVLSQVTRRSIRFARSSLDELRRDRPGLALMWQWFDEVGYGVNVRELARSYPEIAWHDFRGWAREQDWSVLDVARDQQPTA